MSRLPSASVSTAPSACTTAIGVTAGTPLRHRLGAPGEEGPAVGAGDFGLEANDAGMEASRSG